MGTSGSGKSTLLNILGCLDRPTSGDYCIDGVSVNTLSKRELSTLRNRKIGFVFQNYNLLARTTAIENVELPLMYNSEVSAKERRERAEQALLAVGLENRMLHMPNQLSGGQQQRVALIRALVQPFDFLLADEPISHLDDSNAAVMGEMMLEEVRRQGAGLIVMSIGKHMALDYSLEFRV